MGVHIEILHTQLTIPDWPIYNRHPTKWLDQLPPREGVKRVGAAALAAKESTSKQL
jgi:Microsomal signal peptidase 12 kDa subunit (SPC12)